MSAIVWDDVGSRTFEIGIDRGVLYVDGQDGVPWNGLTEVNEKATGGSPTSYYVDGEKYLNVSSPEEFAATITAFTYPDEFMACDGTAMVDTGLYIRHQPRQPFSLSYRTKVGNDLNGMDFAYKIHLIYNALAAPSAVDNKTITDTVELSDFSWDLTVLPPTITGFKSTGHLVFDSRTAHPGALMQLEGILYGTDTTDPRIPAFDELLSIIAANANITVIDNGDGTFTIDADDDALTVGLDGSFTVNSNAVIDNGDGTFTISTN
jgi:hypothetical protein